MSTDSVELSANTNGTPRIGPAHAPPGKPDDLLLFTTDHGTVTAASDWDAPAERKQVRPALPGSYETLFHTTDVDRFCLPGGWAKRRPKVCGKRVSSGRSELSTALKPNASV